MDSALSPDQQQPPEDPPGQAIFGSDSVPQWRNRFEEGTIRRLMKAFGLEDHIPKMRWCQLEYFGESELSFPWFHLAFPGFPVVLTAQHVRYLSKVQMRHLFSDPTRTSVFRAYLQFLDEVAQSAEGTSQAAGLVFQWPGATRMVLHNFTRRPWRRQEPHYEPPSFSMKFLFRGGNVAIMEPFAAFLRRVDGGWKTPVDEEYGVESVTFPLLAQH